MLLNITSWKMTLENYQKERLPFIDLLKGVCIILVVLYHSNPRFPQLSLLRMPLYFALSGLFYSSYSSFAVFAVKRINRLLVPFLFFFSIAVVYEAAACYLKQDYSNLLPRNVFSESMTVDIPLWFLLSLFEVAMYYYVVTKIKNLVVQTVVVVTISYLGYCLNGWGIDLPFFLDSSMTALLFFHFGALSRKVSPGLFEKKRSDYPIIVVAFALFAYTLQTVKPISLMGNSYGSSYLLIVISSFSAITAVFYLCKRVGWIPLVNYFGRYSLVVLGLHSLLLGIQRFYFPGNALMGVAVLLFAFTVIYFSIRFLLAFFPQYIAQAPLLSLRQGRLYFNFRWRPFSINRKMHLHFEKKRIFAKTL